MDSFLRKKYLWIIFFAAVLGAFFRIWHHKDLLFFEVDQARDWRTIEIAIQNGAGELPLLGPGMNASTFRVGPMYHYIQYLAALIFGNSPYAIAYPDLLFSILTIPLFYFFLREYFSRSISSALVLLFSVSLFAIQHGRFAMNSNSLPFFTLLIFYALLKFSQKNEKKWLWLLILAFSLGIIIQLHALSLFVLPTIIIAYLFAAKIKISPKQLAVALLIIIFLNLPMALNEIMSDFQSIESLQSGLAMRENSQKNFSPAKRIVRNSQEIARHYTLIIFSKDVIDSLDPNFKVEGGLDMIKRNFDSSHGKITLALSALSLLFFLFPYFWLFKKYSALKNEDDRRKNFIILIFVWQIVFLPVYLFIIYVQHARYYLPVIFIPYVLLGIYFSYIREKTGRFALFLTVFILLTVNLVFVAKWLGMVEKYSSPNIKPDDIHEYIQDPFYIVNLKQLEAVNAYVENIYAEKKTDIFLIAPKQFYARPIRFLLTYEKNIPVRVFGAKTRDKEKTYLLINSIDVPLEETNLIYPEFSNDFEIIDQKSFGTIYVSRCKIKDSISHKPSLDFTINKSNENSENNDHLISKYTWNQFFNYVKSGKK